MILVLSRLRRWWLHGSNLEALEETILSLGWFGDHGTSFGTGEVPSESSSASTLVRAMPVCVASLIGE